MAEPDRMAPTRRPNRNPVGYQRWHDLTFLHWRVPADELATLLPAGLEVDTFDGSAWVGLVPFRMSRVRPWWFPPLPGVSAFDETNVRTYVHHNGVPGVWFFSLDAANWLAVQVARWRWRLNYHHAIMRVERTGPDGDGDGCGQGLVYSSERTAKGSGRQDVTGPGVPGAGVDLEICLDGVESPEGVDQDGHARPASLEHFLVERYVLFTRDPTGDSSTVYSGQVHHTPYPLCGAEVLRCTESLILASGIEVSGPPEHALYSEGVEVEIFGLEPVGVVAGS
jgi:uncharacterized protein YqjF (DUF2071 family)